MGQKNYHLSEEREDQAVAEGFHNYGHSISSVSVSPDTYIDNKVAVELGPEEEEEMMVEMMVKVAATDIYTRIIYFSDQL